MIHVNQYHVTVDDIVWCTVALGLWGTGFKHTHTLNLPKTHSPIYIHRQKHIEIKYIQHHRIIHEIKSSLFSIVCTIYDWLIFDWALSTRTRLLWKMWRKNDWINEKKSNFTLLIERVWPQKCLNMLVSICKHTHKDMQEKGQRQRENTLLLLMHILLILVPLSLKSFSWWFFYIFLIVNKSNIQSRTNNELTVLCVYPNSDPSYSSVP